MYVFLSFSWHFYQGLGEVVATGPDAKLPVGQAVMYMLFGAFSEYMVNFLFLLIISEIYIARNISILKKKKQFIYTVLKKNNNK